MSDIKTGIKGKSGERRELRNVATAKPLPKITLDKSALTEIISETAEKFDRSINILTSNCCTYPPIKELRMIARVEEIQKLFAKPESVTEKTVDEAIELMQSIVTDCYAMREQFGGTTPGIYAAVKAGLNNLVRLKRYF
jgi:hydroxymethylglutaryl-CoA reductase